MKTMTLELAEKVVDKYDELLELVGADGGIRKALEAMNPTIEEELKIEGVGEEDVAKAREQVKLKVLNEVIKALGYALSMTITSSSSVLNKMAGDKDAMRAAVKDYYKSMGV